MTSKSAVSGDGGETLIETIISVLIIGIAFVAIMAGLATNVAVSVLHRQQATVQTIARDFSEYMQYKAAYQSCATPAMYQSAVDEFKATYQLPDNSTPLSGPTPKYTVSLTGVAYWDGSSAPATFLSTCSADKGAQRFSLNVSTPTESRISGDVVQALQVVKRQ